MTINIKQNIGKGVALGVALILFSAVTAHAVTPQKWQLLRLEQFLKGKFDGISVSYTGALSLAPRVEKLQGPAEEFYLSVYSSQNGDLFLGTGHAGNIYKIDKDGKAELYFHTSEMDVYCLAQDARGTLYAGTSPNGKIYRITASMEGKPFFDPEERYIWDLEFIEDDVLLAAVGETGGIYQISPEGQGTELLKAKENHILCLLRTPEGDLLAGSGGKGRLYRLSRDRTPSILFDSPFEEIRTLTLDSQGTIYAAAGGVMAQPAAGKPASDAVRAAPDTGVTITVTPEGAAPVESLNTRKRQPGALYQIGTDGMAKQIWSSQEDMIYSLLWDSAAQRVIFGTGNRGRIYAADRNLKVSLLLQKESEQVYGLLKGNSRIHTLANNPPELSLIYPEQSSRGKYTSEVFDARQLSSWGRIEWDALLLKGTTLQVQTRSGNSDRPNQTWSNWSPPYQRSEGEQILNPRARYIQFKLLFKTDSGRSSPEISKVTLFYLQANVPPVISQFEILPVNTVFMEPSAPDDKIMGLNVGPAAEALLRKDPSNMAVAKKEERKGYQTVVWIAADKNGDGLLYSLSIKERRGEQWRLIGSRLVSKIFSFETVTLPDGEYEMKLEASDSPSNPQGRELKDEKLSRPFVIDNSLPIISGVEVKQNRSRLDIKFTARDSFSHIREAKYLIRPDEWRILFPQDGICDSRLEQFDLSIALPYQADNMITLKVVDEHGNVGIYRAQY